MRRLLAAFLVAPLILQAQPPPRKITAAPAAEGAIDKEPYGSLEAP
jgi:hypothetical protein